MDTYNTVISPNDHMFRTGRGDYFDVGRSALACIERALSLANVRPTAILDLPCGHGRVCRMLRSAFPDAHLTVCDLDPDGVDFCAAQFAAEPLYSREDVRELALDRSFDLIWCGSLLTHLDRDRWAQILEFFAAHLSPGGVVVFTTHGRKPIQVMLDGAYNYGLSMNERRRLLEDYQHDGFGFVAPANQAFGFSLSSLAFVCAQIARVPSLQVVGLHEAGWADHQDVVSCVKMLIPLTGGTFEPPSGSADEGTPRPASDRPTGNVDAPLRNVSVLGTLHVGGWAGDERGIREVRVLIDGLIVATTRPTVERADVSAAYPSLRHGDDRHGWGVALDLQRPGHYVLSVQAENIDGVSAELGQRAITVPDAGELPRQSSSVRAGS